MRGSQGPRLGGELVVAALVALALGATASASARPGFQAGPIDAATKQRMVGVSWHRGCPVGLNDLRLLKVRHWGFDGRVHRGRLVVHEDSARGMLRGMRRLFRLHFKIRRMRLVDAYGADDHHSMDADNTSAFNCRFVSGTSEWSEHAYGHAIDVNPIENPYADGNGYVSPPAGAPYADRSRRAPGLIHRGGPVVAAIGWAWGGNWSWPKDYQHFSAGGH
ncbi:MAG: M15 family metallopeptidase [Thermoleophilia bacterium]|nr:M15 family metallopeptidase [Thermoleophilia bacterium]